MQRPISTCTESSHPHAFVIDDYESSIVLLCDSVQSLPATTTTTTAIMSTRASHHSHGPSSGTGFYATSLCRPDVRPKRAPLVRTISKDKTRSSKRRSSIRLTTASTIAIKEALGLSSTQRGADDGAMTLLRFPQEILSQILSYLPPSDIVHLGQTCRLAHGFIVPENKLLWRTAFTQVFDDPQQAWSSLPETIRPHHIRQVEQRWSWHRELKRRCLALKAIHPKAIGDFDQNEFTADDVAQTLLEIIDTAQSRPTDADIARGAVPQIDDRSSLNISLLTSTNDPWGRLENFIHDSHTPVDEGDDGGLPSYLIGRPITRSVSMQKRLGSRTERQSRLHVLYGRTAREKLEHGSKGRARRIVYNWNHPVAENEYGPFKADGSGEVNWTVLEGIMSVITRNFEMCVDGRIAMPPGFCYSIPYRTLADPTVPEDWARVTGSWLGTYSFLDYADLFHFNTWNDVSTVPTLEDVPEACGDLMRLELKLDSSLATDPKLQTKLPVCNDYPTLYFSGPSKSYDPFGHPRMQISFRGSVSLCPGGREVRWRYIINYRGHDQWQLEGVQPGGIRSGPVYGTWTQWGHEEYAPVGSFMYVQEELCKKQELVLNRRRRDSS